MGRKICLKPTTEQEILFRKSAGVARWAYNYFILENQRLYQEYLKDNSKPKSISEGALRKYINNDLKKTTHQWLSEVGSNVMKQSVREASLARDRYFKELSGKPQLKSKNKSKLSFYVNYESFKKTKKGFHGEKLGEVKTAEPLPKLINGQKHYFNPHISFDGKYWYISFGYEKEFDDCELTGESLGIDVGVKELAVLSNGTTYHNINKIDKVRKLEKRLRKEQRKLSRKQESNISYRTAKQKPIFKQPLRDCKNYQKQKDKVALIHRQLTNIRTNYLHQTSCEIVKTKPSRIVVEDLNIKGMMKNRCLSRALADQKLSEFLYQIEYKSKRYKIDFVKANRWYKSSKTCSCCGYIKYDLKLSDRTYQCPFCGLKEDRDLNAAVNLANYN